MDPKEAKQLEPKLIKFYHDIIEEESLGNPDSLNRNSIRNLRSAYTKKIRQSDRKEISFASASARCAYIYNYCPCFTSATAFHFAQVLRQDSSKILLEDTLTICCLGGGPAAEIVAISMVLEKVLQNNNHPRQKPLKINAVIIDNDVGWITTVKKVIENLNRDIDQSIVQLTYRFIEFDLFKSQTDDVKDAVRSADVVTMVKVLSVIGGPEDVNEGSRMLQETIQCIRDGGMFFLLDSSGFNFFDMYDRLINSSGFMDPVYGTLKNTYRLLHSSRQCMRNFSINHNTPFRTIFSCNKIGAWCKKSTVPPKEDNF